MSKPTPFPHPQPARYDTLNNCRTVAFAEAERYYYLAYTKDHERKKPFIDWDESYFLAYARLWMSLLAVHDVMDDPDIDAGTHPTLAKQLNEASAATFEECLIAMYG